MRARVSVAHAHALGQAEKQMQMQNLHGTRIRDLEEGLAMRLQSHERATSELGQLDRHQRVLIGTNLLHQLRRREHREQISMDGSRAGEELSRCTQ